MQGFNKVILAGNLTRDPELRYTSTGMAIAKFGLAVNRRWKDQSGEMKEEVTFVDIDSFGKQAELIGQFLKKGRPILIEGRLKLDQWEDKQTQQKRSRLGVTLESFTFLDSGNASGGDFGGGAEGGAPARPSLPPQRSAPPAQQPPADADPMGGEDDDVPF